MMGLIVSFSLSLRGQISIESNQVKDFMHEFNKLSKFNEMKWTCMDENFSSMCRIPPRGTKDGSKRLQWYVR